MSFALLLTTICIVFLPQSVVEGTWNTLLVTPQLRVVSYERIRARVSHGGIRAEAIFNAGMDMALLLTGQEDYDAETNALYNFRTDGQFVADAIHNGDVNIVFGCGFDQGTLLQGQRRDNAIAIALARLNDDVTKSEEAKIRGIFCSGLHMGSLYEGPALARSQHCASLRYKKHKTYGIATFNVKENVQSLYSSGQDMGCNFRGWHRTLCRRHAQRCVRARGGGYFDSLSDNGGSAKAAFYQKIIVKSGFDISIYVKAQVTLDTKITQAVSPSKGLCGQYRYGRDGLVFEMHCETLIVIDNLPMTQLYVDYLPSGKPYAHYSRDATSNETMNEPNIIASNETMNGTRITVNATHYTDHIWDTVLDYLKDRSPDLLVDSRKRRSRDGSGFVVGRRFRDSIQKQKTHLTLGKPEQNMSLPSFVDIHPKFTKLSVISGKIMACIMTAPKLIVSCTVSCRDSSIEHHMLCKGGKWQNVPKCVHVGEPTCSGAEIHLRWLQSSGLDFLAFEKDAINNAQKWIRQHKLNITKHSGWGQFNNS